MKSLPNSSKKNNRKQHNSRIYSLRNYYNTNKTLKKIKNKSNNNNNNNNSNTSRYLEIISVIGKLAFWSEPLTS